MTAPRPWQGAYPEGVRADFVPRATTLPVLLEEIVAEHGPRLALDYYGHRMTYGEIGAAVGRVASGLGRRGIGGGDTVALYLPNCPWHPVFFFATGMAGATVTHLSPLDAPRELDFKCRDSHARVLVTLDMPSFRNNAMALLEAGAVEQVVFCRDHLGCDGEPLPDSAGCVSADALMAEAGAMSSPVHVDPEDVALLQYTGGTTGRPKAAMLTHRNLTAAVLIYEHWFHADATAGPDNRVLLYSPLFHILGLTSSLLRRFREGATIFLKQRFDVAEAVDEIIRHRITAFGGVPTMWIALVNHPGIEGRDLGSLTSIFSGGAPLGVDTFNRVRQLTGLKLRGGWGMTETSPAGTNLPPDAPDDKSGSIGVPLPGVEIEVVALDDPRCVLAPGETGEMRIRGPNVMKGYWNRPEETAAAFVDGWFLTGDIARMDPDGYFHLVDRKSDLIISSGYNVYPQAVENAVLDHPSVAEVVAVGMPDEYRGEVVKLFVTLRRGAPAFGLAELREFLSSRLGRHEMPALIEFRDSLPRTHVGKQSRRLLREAELARMAGMG